VSRRFQLTTLHMHLPLAARAKMIRDRIRFSSAAGHKPRCSRASLQLRDRKRNTKLLKELEGVRSRVGCVVRVDSYRATVDVINCEAGNLAERAWLANADFNRARVATEIANSIRGVSITTRRQYTVSISSRPQLHMPSSQNRCEFVLAAAHRLHARLRTAMQTEPACRFSGETRLESQLLT
jgi:hypothetical protein